MRAMFAIVKQSTCPQCILAKSQVTHDRFLPFSIINARFSGLRFLSNFEFVSAGIDQKVFRWKVNLDNEIDNLEHQVVGSHVSSIADISSLEIISSKKYGIHY